MNLKKYFQHIQSIRNSRWLGVSRRKAKGKSTNDGAGRALVSLETQLTKPGWTKYQK